MLCFFALSFTTNVKAAGDDAPHVSLGNTYSHLDPNRRVPDRLLAEALVYFDANASKIKNKNFITIIDYGMKSNVKRMFVVDMESGAVDAYLVSHGKGSDPNHDGYADAFSNSHSSHMSSLGFALTAETYNGKHGYSLKMDGLSKSNSNDRARTIVFHSADYVAPHRVLGRSHGCPSVEEGSHTNLFKRIKGGSLVYKATSR